MNLLASYDHAAYVRSFKKHVDATSISALFSVLYIGLPGKLLRFFQMVFELTRTIFYCSVLCFFLEFYSSTTWKRLIWNPNNWRNLTQAGKHGSWNLFKVFVVDKASQMERVWRRKLIQSPVASLSMGWL